jgi:hypothetical protein
LGSAIDRNLKLVVKVVEEAGRKSVHGARLRKRRREKKKTRPLSSLLFSSFYLLFV